VLRPKQQLSAIREIPDPPPQMLYIELDAQRKLAEAEAQYYRALVEYELAIRTCTSKKAQFSNTTASICPSCLRRRRRTRMLREDQDAHPVARWAQERASGQVVSAGLVPQRYFVGESPGGNSKESIGRPCSAPLPGAAWFSRA